MPNRRSILSSILAAGTMGAVAGESQKTRIQEDAQDASTRIPESADLDREAVIAAGFTEEEAACWKVTAQAAATFFALPEQHPLDRQEVATAIHVLQNKLLSRPTYRKYIAEAKRLRGE